MTPEGTPLSPVESIAREVRQRLEVCRLFGWDVPLRLRGPSSAAGSPAQGPDVRAERESRLRALAEEAKACTACAISRMRTQVVFGTGNPCARVVFVGEAPGYDEDRVGEPFVGRAGQLLNEIIRAMGLRREDVYIANVVKCHPPKNRTPDASEILACKRYLEAQIDIVRPEVIVALGAVATSFLLGEPVTLSAVRGTFRQYRGIPVMPTYHPAYLLRYPEEKRKAWRDIRMVMARLGLLPR